MSIPGYGGQLDLVDPFIAPSSGTIRGGTEFVILNSGISLTSLCDTFPGVSLDATKWIDISEDNGTVTVNDSLLLSVPNEPTFMPDAGVGQIALGAAPVGSGTVSTTPVLGGTAAVRSISTFDSFDVSAYFKYDTSIERFTPVQEVVYMALRASIDNANHFDIKHIWNPLVGPQIVVSVTYSGSETILETAAVKGSARYLKLMRYNGRVLAFAGADLIHDFRGWTGNAVTINIISMSPASMPRDTLTTVTNVIFRPVITFGAEICVQATEYAGRIIGVTPPYILPEPVEIKAWSNNTDVSIATFTYTAPLQLSLNTKGTLVINNDDTLRDSSTSLKGLRT